MSSPFVHLRLHTEYSLVDSVVRIPALMKHTSDGGMPAVAMTDDSNLFAMVKFSRAAEGRGLKPLFGADLWVVPDDEEGEASKISLLCRDNTGYLNLSKIITLGYQEGQSRGRSRIRRAWIAEHAQGLLALSCAHEGDVGKALLGGHAELARQHLDAWREIFADHYFLELQRLGRPEDEPCVAASLALALDADVPVVATNDVRFLKPEDYDAHELRVCIHDGHVLGDPRRVRRYTPQQYLASPQEMAEKFADIPEALSNSVEIARQCNVTLKLGEAFLPDFPVPENETVDSWLRAEAERGLERRFATHIKVPDAERPEYHERLKTELDVINGMGFPGYFLIVADFIAWAKNNDVPVGPGRGSGAGSLVAYALGITDLDPIAYELLFERFLNPERVSMPDFDVDFCIEGRDKVIDYVAERYGREKVSQIITYGSMAAKAVVRDVGRVLGHPYGFVDGIAKLVPFELDITLGKALGMVEAENPDQAARLKELFSEELRKRYDGEEEVQQLLNRALELEGLVRNAGKHAGGVVIAPGALTDFTPLYCEEGGGGLVTQFDKDDVEAVGLVKFDFLGLRTLTIINRAMKLVNAKRIAVGEPALDILDIPLDDRKSFELLCLGETRGLFQVESAGMRRLIKEMQPHEFEDIVSLVALYRPGPLESGMAVDFCNRKNGKQAVEYPHPSLEPILKPTYGVILYQEQVMQIAQVLAGYSLGGADLLRRAMGKKKPEIMAREKATFIDGSVKNGVDQRQAEYIFDLIEKFAGYGFNKSHSAAYALISYQTAWLKAHYAAEFMCATLSADMDHTDKVVPMIDECRRMGLEVLPPDVNASSYDFTVVDDRTIRYGLGAIKGVGRGAIEAVIEAREQAEGGAQAFVDLHEFCRRVDIKRLNRRVIEALILSGAFDSTGVNRATLAHRLPEAVAAAEQAGAAAAAGQSDMFGVAEVVQEAAVSAEQPEWSQAQRLAEEKKTLGLYLTGHPIDEYRPELRQFTGGQLSELIAEAESVEFGRKKKVVAAGLIVDMRRMRGRNSLLLSLDDGSARVECMLFEEMRERHQNLLIPDALLVVEGEMRYDDYSDGYRIRPSKLLGIDDAREQFARRIVLTLNGKGVDMHGLQDCLERFRSESGCGITIRYRNAEASADTIVLPPEWRISASQGAVDQLQQLFGKDAVEVRYASLGG